MEMKDNHIIYLEQQFSDSQKYYKGKFENMESQLGLYIEKNNTLKTKIKRTKKVLFQLSKILADLRADEDFKEN